MSGRSVTNFAQTEKCVNSLHPQLQFPEGNIGSQFFIDNFENQKFFNSLVAICNLSSHGSKIRPEQTWIYLESLFIPLSVNYLYISWQKMNVFNLRLLPQI